MNQLPGIYVSTIILLILSTSCCGTPGMISISATQGTHVAATTSPVPEHTLNVERTITPSASPVPPPDEALDCGSDWCIYPGHFWLKLPIGTGDNDHIDTSYRYGSTQSGTREEHHGVEYPNSLGTPVLAAANGLVEVAGEDIENVFGLYPGFYGNVVILQHSFPDWGESLFTVYGHLSKIVVSPGEKVYAGQKIGEVGLEGAAVGSHLHFEVRQGLNRYDHTVNPQLWLSPHLFAGTGELEGVLAIRLPDLEPAAYSISVNIERMTSSTAPNGTRYYGESYAWNTPVSPVWNENLVFGDLPEGEYRITFILNGVFYDSTVPVAAGRLTIASIQPKP